ncbi:hypothetical protein IFO70_01020 [Phormidium tenue FACHB-886]|nr:hypothetical protein [Phormidium tenue FACHB-886]
MSNRKGHGKVPLKQVSLQLVQDLAEQNHTRAVSNAPVGFISAALLIMKFGVK